MRAVAALLALSACAADDGADVDTGGPLVERTMRVIATPLWVALFVDDPQSPSTCTYGHFAEPGTCVANSDGLACSTPPPGACLRYVALERDGVVLSEWIADPAHEDAGPYQLRVSHIAPPTHVAIRGCGGTERIPIGATGPEPTAVVTRTASNHLHIAWTTDRAAAGAIVQNSAGEMCQTTATELESQTPFSTYGEASVVTFDPPQHVSTIWGVVDVYTGGIDGGTLPP